MEIKIINKEVINVVKFEIQADDKNYFIYVSQNKEMQFSEFYIGEEDCSIISFCIGCQWEDITPSIEKFINDNIEEWIKNYNDEDKIIDEYYNNEIDVLF